MPTWSTVACVAAFALSTAVAAGGSSASQSDVFDRVTHGTAVSEGGVKIHYASLGPTSAGATVGKNGPLVVMIHGFPDFWYSWRHQMDALAPNFQVVAEAGTVGAREGALLRGVRRAVLKRLASMASS